MNAPFRLWSITLLACSALACTKAGEDTSAKSEATPTPSETPVAQATPTTKHSDEADTPEPEPEPEPQPATPSAAEVEVAAPEPVAVEPGTVPIAPIVATEASAPWREAATGLAAPIGFVNLAGGVLGESGGGYYDIADDGQLVRRDEIEAPAAPLMGYWPKNVWYIELRIKLIEGDRSDDETREYRLMRLRGNKRWVPQEYEGEQRFVDNGEDFRVGGNGGLLVSSAGSITRVAGTADDPDVGILKSNTRIEFAETNSGRIYSIMASDGALLAQRDCSDQACVDENAVLLPYGVEWEFSLERPRQRHSMSMVASASHEGADKHHVMHYETGGWKLESLSIAPTGLWATKDGGLWARVGEELWHRDPDGGWRNIALPEGASDVSVAMRADQSELWIAAVIDGKPTVLATHANAQQLPPEQPTIETQTG